MPRKFTPPTTLRKGHTLMLRTCVRDSEGRLTAHGGFIWPAHGVVEAPDWKPTKECGNGLHGFLRGCGAGGLAGDVCTIAAMGAHALPIVTAIVMRDTQVSSPASLARSICQTWVLRPMCTGRAVPVTQPLVAPRRWLALTADHQWDSLLGTH